MTFYYVRATLPKVPNYQLCNFGATLERLRYHHGSCWSNHTPNPFGPRVTVGAGLYRRKTIANIHPACLRLVAI